MNIINYHFAYCLYPHATMLERRSIVHMGEARNPGSVHAHRKWEKRGWQMIKENTSNPHLDYRTVNRYIGDRFSWHIPCEHSFASSDFHDDGSPSPLTDVLNGHSWQLLYSSRIDDGFYTNYAWVLFPHFDSTYMSLTQSCGD